jgi:hypothetical protein
VRERCELVRAPRLRRGLCKLVRPFVPPDVLVSRGLVDVDRFRGVAVEEKLDVPAEALGVSLSRCRLRVEDGRERRCVVSKEMDVPNLWVCICVLQGIACCPCPAISASYTSDLEPIGPTLVVISSPRRYPTAAYPTLRLRVSLSSGSEPSELLGQHTRAYIGTGCLERVNFGEGSNSYKHLRCCEDCPILHGNTFGSVRAVSREIGELPNAEIPHQD